jgi:hypothetical protein
MRKRLPRIYYLIPVIYVGVIAFFLYMQFHSRQPFEERIGALAVSGAYSTALSGRKQIRDLMVSCNDVHLEIGGRAVQLLAPASMRSRRIRAVTYHRFDRGVEIDFSQDVHLRFSLQGELDNLVALEVVLPDNLKGFPELSLPYQPKGDKAEWMRGIPLLRLNGRLGIRYAALPAGSTIDLRKRLLNMNLADREDEPVALFSRVEQAADEPYLFWFSRQGPLAGKEDYRLRLEPYLDRAYRHWDQLLASAPDVSALAKGLGICLLSEALKRGEYDRVLPLAAAALRQAQQSSLDFPAAFDGSAYIGYLSLHLSRGRQEAEALIFKITEAIQRSDPQVFGIPELIRFIVNRAPLSLAEETLRLADSVDRQKATQETLLGMLATYVGAGRFLDNRQVMQKRITELIDRWILPSIIQIPEGLFLATPAGGQEAHVELLLSLRAGRLLIDAGRLTSRPSLETLGLNLILGALSWSDAEGFIPARAIVKEGLLQSQSGRLEAEALYPLVADRRFLPEEYPLYPDLSPGTWLYTAAVPEQLQIEPSQYRFTFSYPVGAAHYFLLQEIRPMQGIILHEIPWKPDAQYSQYTDGWVYDPESQTLFGKITHRQPNEELIVNY